MKGAVSPIAPKINLKRIYIEQLKIKVHGEKAQFIK